MKIEDLRNLGAFCDDTPVAKKVSIGGHELDVGVLRVSFSECMKMQENEKNRHAAFIARCIVFDNGERMKLADAEKLDSRATLALLTVIGEVNGISSKDDAGEG